MRATWTFAPCCSNKSRILVLRLIIVDDATKLRFRVAINRRLPSLYLPSIGTRRSPTHPLFSGRAANESTVDLGSQISIISYAEYKRSLSRHKLRHADVNLRGYGAAPITCFGYLEVPVEYGESRIPAFRLYVTKRGDCLLGVDLFDRLGFRIAEPGASTTFATHTA